MSAHFHPFITQSLHPVRDLKSGLRWGFDWHISLCDGSNIDLALREAADEKGGTTSIMYNNDCLLICPFHLA